MDDYRHAPLVGFFMRFRRSPVRWVVLAHAALLVAAVVLCSVFPTGTMRLLDGSLVMAQIALLLIWMTLDGKMTIRRTFGVAIVAVLIQTIHAIPYGGAGIGPGILCTILSMVIVLCVLSIPLAIAQSMGLQLRYFSEQDMPPPRRLQFSIRSGLVASVVVAILFGLKGIPEMFDRQPGSFGNSFGTTLAIVTMGLIAAAIYLSIPLVAVWAVLTPGKILPRLAMALVGWGLGTALVFHYTWIDEDPIFVLTVPAAATVVALPILLATLLVLRAMRYRVVWETGYRPAGSPFPPATLSAEQDPFEGDESGRQNSPFGE